MTDPLDEQILAAMDRIPRGPTPAMSTQTEIERDMWRERYFTLVKEVADGRALMPGPEIVVSVLPFTPPPPLLPEDQGALQ